MRQTKKPRGDKDLLRELSSTTDFEHFFVTAAQGAAAILDADGAGLALQEGEHWQYRFFTGTNSTLVRRIKEFRGHLHQGAVGRVLASGKPLYMPRYAIKRAALAEFTDTGVHACYVVPMKVNGRIEGALSIAWCRNPPHRPSSAQVRQIETLVGFMGSAYYCSKLEAALQRDAHHDSLTGLPNRGLLMDRLATARRRSLRNDRLLAVILLDLDHFQQINDSLGHRTGDALLASVGSRVTDIVRSCDTVARLAGDEFVILLEDISHVQQVESVLDRLIGALGEPLPCAGHKLPAHASLGFTIFPFDDSQPHMLLHHADQAMYGAKRAGGNGYQGFEHAISVQLLASAELRTELEFGLDHDPWSVAYSPICQSDGNTVAIEAHLLWQHPHRGLIRADQIGTDVDPPFSGRLTTRLLDLTADNPCIPDSAFVGFHLNIQPADIDDPRLLERIDQWLRTTGLAADRLVIELPESAFTTRFAATRALALDLHARHIKLIYDEIRAGCELQLWHLLELPFSGIKCALSAQPSTARLISTLGAIARTLDVAYFADRVDDLSTYTLAMQRQFGFSRMQGAWIGPLMEGPHMVNWLKTRSHQSTD